MKPPSLLLFIFLPPVLAILLLRDAPSFAATDSTLSYTNGTLFDCEGGAFFSATKIILRDRVRVLDQASAMYLECDLLTIWLQTNTTREARASEPVHRVNQTNQFDAGRLERIVAEGNVYITTVEQQIVGDRAEYTATNDLFVVTGDMVILGVPQGVGVGKRAIFDRVTGTARAVGEFAFESLGSLRGAGTNSSNLIPRRSPTNAPPVQRK